MSSQAPNGIDLAGVWKATMDSPSDDDKHTFRSLSTKGPPQSGQAGTPALGRNDIEERLKPTQRLTIEQYPTLVTIQSDDEIVTCDTTNASQVSTEDGATAQQTCGWDSASLVIELQAKTFTRVDRYTLASSGKRLIHVSEMRDVGANGRTMGMHLQRAFERANKQ